MGSRFGGNKRLVKSPDKIITFTGPLHVVFLKMGICHKSGFPRIFRVFRAVYGDFSNGTTLKSIYLAHGQLKYQLLREILKNA